ncbi:MAG: DUF616 domain-containing protein [Verrucomicrobia bacterium]|nr:DUF616 domain-containing protein [Verrucomicrobiota bacterium]
MKVVCYTVLVGGYDTLRDPSYLSENWDYVCFTNQPLKTCSVWKARPLKKVIDADAIRTCRWHKMHTHLLFPEYELSIYIDANVQITGPHLESRLNQFITDNTLLALPPHPQRTCVYDEVDECIQTHRDCAVRIRNMEQLLKAENFPRQAGLFENNLIFRAHNHPGIVRLNVAWWDLIITYSRRDQLSLTYLLWKHRIDAEFIVSAGRTIRDYPGYRYRLHKHLCQADALPKRPKLARFVSIWIPVRRWRHTARDALSGPAFRKTTSLQEGALPRQ